MIEKRYSIGNLLRLSLDLIFSKLVWTDARLVRFPVYIRGRRYLKLGKNFTIGRYCRFDLLKLKNSQNPELVIGNNVQINDFVHICVLDKIEIGDDVLIASHVYISDNSHGSYKGDINDSNPMIPPIRRHYPTLPVKIGNRVWIGEGAMILPGVTIGEGSIIGAHSLVNKEIPANTIAVGTPAKIIKRYDFNTGFWERTNPDGSFIEK